MSMLRRHRMQLLGGLSAAGLVLLVVGPQLAGAGQPDAPTGYDLRAARAIFNAFDPASVPDPKNIRADLPRRLTVWDVVDDKRTYALNFGTRGEDHDSRGYYRIVLNGKLSDASAKGWRIVRARDPDTGAEVFWKRVERTAAKRYGYVGVRRKIGNVVLTVTQRRPFEEEPEAAARAILPRFAALLEAAKDNKLFARIVVYRIDEDGHQSEVDLAAGPLLLDVASDTEPTRLRLRIQVRDANDQPLEGVQRFTLQLLSPLKELIHVRGATWSSALKCWVVMDQDVADLELQLDPAGGRLRAKLFDPAVLGRMAGENPVAPIRMRVGVKLSKSGPDQA